MTAWESHTGTLTLDAPEGYSDCPATYTITTGWDHTRLVEWNGCALDEWTFGGRKQTRDTAVDLLGHDEVSRQERIAGDEWAYANRRRFAA